MHDYIYPYRMFDGRHLGIYDSVTMYLGLTHSIRKNKEKVDLEFFLFLLHVNDGDRCGGLLKTRTLDLSKFSDGPVYFEL